MPLRRNRVHPRRALLLGFLLLAPACGGATTPDATAAAACVRDYVEAARAGDVDAARRCLDPRLSLDADAFQDQHRRWMAILDTWGLELVLLDVARDGESALVPYRLTGKHVRDVYHHAGLFTLQRTDDAWRIVEDELAPLRCGPPLAPFPVRLPLAGSAVEACPAHPPAVVHVAADGRVWMDGSYVADEADLRDRLAAREPEPWPDQRFVITSSHDGEPEGLNRLPLVLRADRAVAWCRVASLLRVACDPQVLMYKVAFRTTRTIGLSGVPRELQVCLLDPRDLLDAEGEDEEERTPPPPLAVELDSSGRHEADEAPTTARVAEGEPVAIRGAALREALRHAWAALENDPDTVVVIGVAPGADERIPLEDVVTVIAACVQVGLCDVRFEGLACVRPHAPR